MKESTGFSFPLVSLAAPYERDVSARHTLCERTRFGYFLCWKSPYSSFFASGAMPARSRIVGIRSSRLTAMR